MKTKMILFFLILGLMAATGCGRNTVFGPDTLADDPVGETGIGQDDGGNGNEAGDDVSDEVDPIPDLGGFVKPPSDDELYRP